ncbi:MAG: immune inhibitor A [Candidatus Atribacteria bacterium]|nr:immune inhibitor A [Candidatus Atribacteria bacterium]
MKKSSSIVLIVAGIVLALCCCLIVILSGTFYAFNKIGRVLPTIAAYTPDFLNDPTPAPFDITRQPVDASNSSTQLLLEQSIVPDRDMAVLACRFKNICDVPATISPPAAPPEAGAQTQLWLLNTDSNDFSSIHVTLQYVTPHAYFWVEDGVNFNQNDAQKLIDTFEKSIYPTDREFFGSEWTPGVDGDPHLYIVYARNLGGMVAGFYNTGDEYPPQISQYSNAHESFYIDSSQGLADEYTYGVLAHEFQHMIHWYQDRNESSFLNEGFSELATFLNGYDTGGFDWYYTSNPDMNLTDWLGGSEDNSAHYGANFLFVTYFLDRFGKDATQALVHDQQNSLASVDNVLQQSNITDPITSQPVTADDFFLDWTLANYLHDPAVADGRYTYHNYPNSPTSNDTEGVSTCPQAQSTRNVNQYGVDYIRITCSESTKGDSNSILLGIAVSILCVIFLIAVVSIILVGIILKKRWGLYFGGGALCFILLTSVILFFKAQSTDRIDTNKRGNYTLHFNGSTLTRLLPADPHSGSYAFWSNKGDESNMTLTRQFDLTGVSGPVTFTYWTWYDLENDYDYVFLEASTDDVSWSILTTPSGTGENPSGSSYGWGYNGQSNGWIQETVDLSQFAGQEVSLRFDYITDAAVNGEGFQLDDITIPEIGYSEGFESGDGGWEGNGFVRIQNVLPQTFRLALITHAGNGTTVDIIPVTADQKAQIPVNIGSNDVQDVVLVVTATTRFTREQTAYQFEIR